jgi:phage tail-like protein
MPFGVVRSFHKKFKFLCEVDGFNFFGFQKCSEISAEIAKVEYHEGGALLANKGLGRITVPDVTIERAACADMDCWTWFKLGANLLAQTGATAPQNAKDFTTMQLDRDGTELREIPCTGGQPIKFVAGDWDNEADENVIEKLTVMIDTFDIISLQGGGAPPGGGTISISL